jgi:hypothetical protein
LPSSFRLLSAIAAIGGIYAGVNAEFPDQSRAAIKAVTSASRFE